jgi:hypothetical protein
MVLLAASLPRSWPTPELRIPNAAAQTRIVSKRALTKSRDGRFRRPQRLGELYHEARGATQRYYAASVKVRLCPAGPEGNSTGEMPACAIPTSGFWGGSTA